MAIKIISAPKEPENTKHCKCTKCSAILSYTPSDVVYKTYSDYGGGSDSYAQFTCPNCGQFLQICQ